MAEEQERMDSDPLSCMPAETYLNAAIAYQFAERFAEALEAATNASQAAQKASRALSEIKQQPQVYRMFSPEEAQNQLMTQVDVDIQSYLIRGQVLEHMNRFEEANKVLAQGKNVLEQHFGS